MRASYMIYFKNQTTLSVNVNEQENGKTAEHHAAQMQTMALKTAVAIP